MLIENELIETKIIDCLYRVHFEIFSIMCFLIVLKFDRKLQNHLRQTFYRRFDFVDVVTCKNIKWFKSFCDIYWYFVNTKKIHVIFYQESSFESITKFVIFDVIFNNKNNIIRLFFSNAKSMKKWKQRTFEKSMIIIYIKKTKF